MKPTILILLCSLISQAALAQRNFQPATVVTYTGDTLKGEIDFRDWGRCPRSVNFRETGQRAVRVLNAHDVYFFECYNEQYMGLIMEVECSEFSDERLPFNSDLVYRTDTAFARVLVSGPKALLFYKDRRDKEHFLILDDLRQHEYLLLKRFKDAYGDQGAIACLRKYRDQLTKYFSGCKEAIAIVDNAAYNRTDLMSAFEAYYTAKGITPTYSFQKQHFQYHFGGVIGMSQTKFDIMSYPENPANDVKFTSSNRFSGGIGLDIVFPRNQRRFAVRPELIYNTYTTEGSYSMHIGGNGIESGVYNFEYSYLKLNALLNYKLWIKTVDTYFLLGFSNGYGFNETNYRKKVETFPTFTNVREGRYLLPEETRYYEQGYILGLGFSFKHIGIEARYENGNGFSRVAGIGMHPDRYYLFFRFFI